MNAARRLKLLVALAASGLLTTVVLLGLALRPREGPVCSAEECGPPPVSIPAAIRFGPQAPVVTILLWIDLESAASRQIYQQVTRAVAASRRDITTDLRLLHLPATACQGSDPSLGCLGARLVECAEASMPGAGVQVAGVLLDLQWRPPGGRTAEAAETGVAGLGLDAEALLACAANSPAADATLRVHAELAARYGLAAAPGGLVVETADPRRSSGFGAWLTESSLRAIIHCLAQRRCEEVA
jgi:hypothetical protein